ncbi:MAG TPA: hypothetical protein VIF57_20435, partial [Polyangia bacterium]
MKWLGAGGRVSMSLIEITDDIRARMGQPHVAELAASFDEATGGEPGNALWLQRKGDKYEVVAGRDRCAALLLKGATEAPARIGDWSTPGELRRATIIENLRRRADDRDAMIAELVGQAEASQDGPPWKAPSKQAAKAGARKQVARQLGITPKAVKQAEHRDKARKAEAAAPATPEARPPAPSAPPPIETWGIALDDVTSSQVIAVQRAVDAADKHLRAAQAALTELGATTLSSALSSRFKDDAHRLAANIRAARPVALCPWCKDGQEIGDGYVDACHACGGKAWVTAEQLDAAPPELLTADVYALDGEFVSLAEATKRWRGQRPGPKKNGKHIKITGTDGEP